MTRAAALAVLALLAGCSAPSHPARPAPSPTVGILAYGRCLHGTVGTQVAPDVCEGLHLFAGKPVTAWLADAARHGWRVSGGCASWSDFYGVTTVCPDGAVSFHARSR